MTSAGSRTLLDEYGRDHRTRGNEVCHFIGIPLIVAALLGLAARVPLYPGAPEGLHLALATTLAVLAFHWRLDRVLAVTTFAWALTATWLCHRIPAPVLVGLFVLGWCLQLAGHAGFERRRPSFTRRPIHLLVGPLWLVGRLLGRLPPASVAAEIRP